jgi:ABC-type antimicrobial peptide transport system permease subunit
MLAMNGAPVGALIGFLIGVGLSIYVALLDYRKREAGVRTRAEYRLSLLAVPLILAAVGAGLGALIAH